MTVDECCDLISERCPFAMVRAKRVRRALRTNATTATSGLQFLIEDALGNGEANWTPKERDGLQAILVEARERMTEELRVKVSPRQREQVEADAEKAGMSVSAWVRNRLGL